MNPATQIQNIDKAIARWATVKPEAVIRELRYYHDESCGSTACFGGHVAHWGDLFPGVHTPPEAPSEHYPCLYVDGRLLDPVEISTHLFGDEKLFARRGDHPADKGIPREVRDHTIVLIRLAWARRNLVEKANT